MSLPNCLSPEVSGPPPIIQGSLAQKNPHPERHLDWFSRFSTAHGCDQQTHKQTNILHTQTQRHTGHAASVTIGHVFARHAFDADQKLVCCSQNAAQYLHYPIVNSISDAACIVYGAGSMCWTVVRPSVRLSVPSIDSSSGVRLVCC